jgi:stage II sporulation protein M
MPLNVRIPGPIYFCKYVWGLRLYILAIILIFAVFFAIGYAAVVAMPDMGSTVVSSFKQEVSPLKELSPLGMMIGIFANNAFKCLLVMVLGLGLGIVPIGFVLANGLILGVVVAVTLKSTSLLYVLVGIVPHGIFELPMVFISAAIGLKLGMDVLKAAMGKEKNLMDKFVESLLIFIVWIFPILFVAACVETFVTGPILYLLFGAHG